MVDMKVKNVVETKAAERGSMLAILTLLPAGAVQVVPAQKCSHQNINNNLK